MERDDESENQSIKMRRGRSLESIPEEKTIIGTLTYDDKTQRYTVTSVSGRRARSIEFELNYNEADPSERAIIKSALEEPNQKIRVSQTENGGAVISLVKRLKNDNKGVSR